MKEAILKRLHSIGLKLYCLLEKAKQEIFKTLWLLGFETTEKYWMHEAWRNFQVGRNYSDTLKVDIWHKFIKTHQTSALLNKVKNNNNNLQFIKLL